MPNITHNPKVYWKLQICFNICIQNFIKTHSSYPVRTYEERGIIKNMVFTDLWRSKRKYQSKSRGLIYGRLYYLSCISYTKDKKSWKACELKIILSNLPKSKHVVYTVKISTYKQNVFLHCNSASSKTRFKDRVKSREK